MDKGRTTRSFWIGESFSAPNLSGGYHGILKQWWDAYVTAKVPRVLLVSESPSVKRAFETAYLDWSIDILDLHTDLAPNTDPREVDIVADLCARPSPVTAASYDLVVNQATMEHLYDPFGAMRNMVAGLAPGGALVSHTHPPAFPHHSYPRDYFRFMRDWWYDLPSLIGGGLVLEELVMTEYHVFTCYTVS